MCSKLPSQTDQSDRFTIEGHVIGDIYLQSLQEECHVSWILLRKNNGIKACSTTDSLPTSTVHCKNNPITSSLVEKHDNAEPQYWPRRSSELSHLYFICRGIWHTRCAKKVGGNTRCIFRRILTLQPV